jgi:uncharacterized membrane protein
MIIWGAAWGAVLGYLVVRNDGEFGFFLGAVLGALAGLTLRNAVRREVAAQKATWPQPVEPAPPSATAAPASAATQALNPQPAEEALQPSPVGEPLTAAATASQPTTMPTGSVGSPAMDNPWSNAAATASAAAQAPTTPTVSTPDFASRAIAAARAWLLGGNTIVRMGVVVLFVGLAFLAKYAIDNSMLPPEVRLAGIGLFGIGLFGFGFRLRAKGSAKLAYALTLQGAGIAVLYLTVFGAFRLYQLLPAGAAFAMLGLICAFSAVIALLQNAMVIAFIGFAGAFAAPLLVSTGQGNHVGLFSYYLLLNLAIAVIAWWRAWRPLNLLGFFATFGVATAWGVLKYQPDQLTTTAPFLVAFFLIYVVASLLYATRHSLVPKQAVDATLIFGTPIVAFGLLAGMLRLIEYATAFSSLAMGAFYLGLGWWAVKRQQDSGVGQWLAQCFLALGLGFVTLAVPLALDPRWTSAVWAAEGVAVYWMGQRQARWLPRLAGLALQGFAALSYLSARTQIGQSDLPLANPAFIGALLLALSALALAHWSRDLLDLPSDPIPSLSRRFALLEFSLSPVWFWVGFLWWQLALEQEIAHLSPGGGWRTPAWIDNSTRVSLHMLAWVGSAFAFHHLALAKRLRPWAIAATPAWFVLPFMVLAAFEAMTHRGHVFQNWGWLVWLVALVMHIVMLRRLDNGPPPRLWSWTHSGGVWLLVLLGGNFLLWLVESAQLYRTAWASVILLTSATGVLLLLSFPAWFDPTSRARARWPLAQFSSAYLWRAAAPVAALVALGSLAVAIYSDGNARPLPYVPLLNPTDLTVALGIASCVAWLVRVRRSPITLPQWMRHQRLPLGWVALAFVALNTVWLRAVHQFTGVPWSSRALFDSFLVQAGYSILWTVLALGSMIVAHKRLSRPLWMGGAALLALTVAKLFLIDLSNRGGSERIVVFIAVGLLMLVVGYFAPLPPAAAKETAPQTKADDPQEAAA